MRGFLLLQAYKDRKELKTTYIFYSWSFKSMFLKEDFCCFVWDFGFFFCTSNNPEQQNSPYFYLQGSLELTQDSQISS